MKQEQETVLGHKIEKKEWRKNNVLFLSNHKYFTDYGQEILEPKKHENLLTLQKKKEAKKVVEVEEETFPYVYEPSPFDPNADKKLREEQKKYGTWYSNHVQDHFQ